ncbi:MAG: ABC transporter permease [Clostridia bacterium]|nr:ABC transporter permease [Clostridia bacterium]
MIALSVTIGVMSVAIIDIVGDAGIAKFNRELDCLGISGISVTVEPNSGVQPLNTDDVKLIDSVENVKSAMGIIKTSGTASAKADNFDIAIVGIGENADKTISLELKHGRYINEVDIKSISNVCMIDEDLSIEMFNTDNSVGMLVDINSNTVFGKFEIIGVIPTEGSILRNVAKDLIDSNIYIPYSNISNSFSTVAVSVDNTDHSEDTTAEIRRLLGYQKGNVDSVITEDMALQRGRINNLFDIIKQVLTIIGATSIVVSALSIMTIMLLTVKERTYEIGIKKSIGASNSRVLFEFVIESGAVSLIGGVLGVVLSLAASFIMANLLKITVTIDFLKLLWLIVLSIFVGCISGAYPAITAARLNPVDALGRN